MCYCMLEAIEGGRCWLKALEAWQEFEVLEVPEVMRCVLRCMLESGFGLSFVFEISIVEVFSLGLSVRHSIVAYSAQIA